MIKIKQINSLSFIFLFNQLQSIMLECCFARFLPEQRHLSSFGRYTGCLPLTYNINGIDTLYIAENSSSAFVPELKQNARIIAVKLLSIMAPLRLNLEIP